MKIQLLIATGILGTVLAAQAVPVYPVLYQSDFTGTTLADAGLTTSPGTDGNWTLDDANDRVTGSGGSNSRASLYTINSWQSDGGLTLDVTFRAEGGMAFYSIGIVDADYTPNDNSSFSLGYAGAYGIGFVGAGYLDGPGPVSGLGAGDSLVFNDGTGSGGDKGGSIKISIDQGNIGTGLQTLSITVTPDSWSYSLNGQTPTTGSFSTPFDTSRSYRFVGQAQRVHEQKYFYNITLSAVAPIPTLSEWGMILLVGLVVLVMGRRMLRKPLDSAPTEA